MTQARTVLSLARLVALRDVEVDRLTADVAQKEALRQRYHHNLDRMAQLCADSAATGSLPPSLSLNCGNYKQAVFDMMAAHQRDLALHEADMAVTQRALQAASLKRETLDRVREQHSAVLQVEQDRREQKRQDELATQAWYRQRAS
ncbi:MULTISPECIES: flagellar export protein FliJ [Jeongeupia]|uniref:Flagellar FliJ protein n=2 Tax=Jeongeupia TaxID=885864 RepID=A0ABS2BGH4_9NEIS|nr:MULTISPECIES: flagellar export protein FliJ [Jeongeupia]MBM3114717.1 flagellar export protein FliJ [Jeongeupia naejangsanensis]GHD63347.1 hypothetical protein GCM10007350_20560 [Jeongeupia chitinilytica]